MALGDLFSAGGAGNKLTVDQSFNILKDVSSSLHRPGGKFLGG